MSRQARKAKKFVRGRRHLTVGLVIALAVGAGLFAGSNFSAIAGTTGGTTTTPDSCGYNPAAAPKPGGGTVLFDENSVTRGIKFYGTGSSGHIGVFANDESSLFVGANGSAFQSAGTMTLASGLTLNTTYTSISVNTPHPAVTSGDAIAITHGSTTQNLKATAAVAAGVAAIPVQSFKASVTYVSGDKAVDGNAAYAYGDVEPAVLGTGNDPQGRPVAPSLYVTDITNNSAANSGDWEQGGASISPTSADGLFGGWSNVIGKPPANKNNWNLGPHADDPVAAGVTGFNEGYGTEVRWNVGSLSFTFLPGHTYRVQSITHDDDQNHTSGGGDVGEVCTTISFPGITTVGNGGTLDPTTGLATISDKVTVGGVTTPLPSGTNKVTVSAFYNDNTCATANFAGSGEKALNTSTPNGDYTPTIQVSQAGTYYYVAHLILGGVDVADSGCNDPGENGNVNKLVTTLNTNAGGPYAPTHSLTDIATLSGGTHVAGGFLHFKLFADNGSGGCGVQIGATQDVAVDHADGTPTYSATVTDNAIGPGASGNATFHWSVSYDGDTNNKPSSDGVNPCPAVDSTNPPNHENPVVLYPHIAISKDTTTPLIETGTAGSFTITVTNDGNVALTNVNVTDPLSSDCVRTSAQTAPLIAAVGNNDSSFDPGESFNYTCSSPTLTANLHNTATDHGTAGNTTVTASDSADITVITPAIRVVKNPKTQSVPLGGTANFSITVTNVGDTGLTNVVVNDPFVKSIPNTCSRTAAQTTPLIQAVGNNDSTFDVGESFTYSCTAGPVTAAFTNVVQACGDDQLSTTVCDTNDNGGNPPPGCPTGVEADHCGSVGISGLTTTQDFKPKDTAHLTGISAGAGGTLTYRLYAGNCATGTLLDTLSSSVSGPGNYPVTDASFLSALLAAAGLGPDTAGTYYWGVNYSGSPATNDAPLPVNCTENFTVDNGS
jgi:uncharacterized repeat protein (TIGR01451 family)